MDIQNLMNEYLAKMTQENEQPCFPIFGAVKLDSTLYNAFLSISKKRLLITFIHRRSIGATIETNLDLKYVRILKKKWSKQRTIILRFQHDSPIEIFAFPNIKRLENQETNLQSFIDFLTQKAPAPLPLKEQEGIKLRHQYINVYLAMLAVAFGIFLPVFFMLEWSQYGMSFAIFCSYLYNILPILDLFFTPLIIFSLLNRFCFGKIVCVLNENGFYMENDFYQWNEIQSIFLMQDLPGKRDPKHNTAVLTIQNGEDPYKVELPYFPFFGRHTIKKFAPQVPIIHDKTGIIVFIIAIVVLFLFALFICLFGI